MLILLPLPLSLPLLPLRESETREMKITLPYKWWHIVFHNINVVLMNGKSLKFCAKYYCTLTLSKVKEREKKLVVQKMAICNS